jgi:L-ascorbate 6-phosphate lactonase
VLEQVRSHTRGLAVWWMGNAGWLIKSDDVLIATDLDLEPEGKVRQPPATAESLAEHLAVLFVTHHHTDHCNPATLRALAQRSDCLFVLPRTCLAVLDDLALPEHRLIIPEPQRPFTVDTIRVEPIHAVHGDHDFTVLTREPGFIDGIRYNCGYVLTIAGKRFLQPGDSLLTEEHLDLTGIDVLFVSPTVHNMHVDRSLILINRLEPSHIFPQHFGTYTETADNMFWTRGYPDELERRLSSTLRQRFHKLPQGHKFTIE